jgi:hypothetical protein
MHKVKSEDNVSEFNDNDKNMYSKMEVSKRRLVRPKGRFSEENKGEDDVHIHEVQTIKLYLR